MPRIRIPVHVWPRPGICVAYLGGYAVLCAVIGADPLWARALVGVGAFLLMTLEIRAITKDRDAHDAEMARLREESEDRFEKTLAGFAATQERTEAIQRELENMRLMLAQLAALQTGDPQASVLLNQATVSMATIASIMSTPDRSTF